MISLNLRLDLVTAKEIDSEESEQSSSDEEED
jgi:hypothetical protein